MTVSVYPRSFLPLELEAEAQGEDWVQAGAGRILVIEGVPPATGPALGDTWTRPANGMRAGSRGAARHHMAPSRTRACSGFAASCP
jgi:hypothetical protein